MSDVRVRISFKNDLFQQLLDEQELPMYKLATVIGLSMSHFMGLKSLKRSPFAPHNREEYSNTAYKIAAYFRVPPEILFPEDIYRIKWPSYLEKRFPVERIAALVESEDQKLRALMPHEAAEENDRNKLIDEMLGTLTSREERVIRMRFGIGDVEEAHTLEEVGQDLEVTRERIRQVEAKAIRKLRHENCLGAVLNPSKEVSLTWNRKRPISPVLESDTQPISQERTKRGPKPGSKWLEKRIKIMLRKNNGEYYSMTEDEKEKAWREATRREG